LDIDTSAMPIGEMIHHRQSETAQTFALRSEEGIEGADRGLLRHSNAAVLDAKLDDGGPSLSHCCRINGDQTAVRHRIACVEREIQNRVLQAQPIASYGREIGFHAKFEMDIGLPCGTDEGLDLGQAGADIRVFEFAMTLLRSAYCFPDKRTCSPQGGIGAGDHGLECWSRSDARVPSDAVQRG